MRETMDKVLISGGNGFLGSHLAERAIKEGFEVTILDDFSTSNKVNVPKEVNIIKKKVEDLDIQDDFQFIVHLAAFIICPSSILLHTFGVGTHRKIILQSEIFE